MKIVFKNKIAIHIQIIYSFFIKKENIYLIIINQHFKVRKKMYKHKEIKQIILQKGKHNLIKQ